MPGAGTFKLFIGNVDEKTSPSDLKALFEKYGKYHNHITQLSEIITVFIGSYPFFIYRTYHISSFSAINSFE